MKRKNIIILIAVMFTVVLSLIIADKCFFNPTGRFKDYPNAEKKITVFAKNNNIFINEYPEDLIKLLENNPETEDFVLNYPLKKNSHMSYSLTAEAQSEKIEQLMQWDMRWGYEKYAGSLFALSGCGPTCLSMICLYLLHNEQYTPAYIADFAEKENYATHGNGTKWLLMSEGAEKLGLKSKELPLDKNVMINALNNGMPIICIMGEGDFTSSGHYIVITSYSAEGFHVFDPNSRTRSEKTWKYEDIESQIRNIWAYSI